jgi:uncharacterized RmlC-like cupin family protein
METSRTCTVVRSGETFAGLQGLTYGAGMPHLPANHGAETLEAVIARTDPNGQESVVLLPHLDARIDAVITARAA